MSKSKKGATVSVATLLVALLGVVVLVFAGGLAFALLSKDDKAQATTVTAEPTNTAINPFMPSVGTDQTNVTPPTAATPVGNTSTAPPTQRYSGDTEGLYGGTMNYRTCDAKKMIDFFSRNPAKAASWADVLGIQASEISSYLSSLTPVLLRSDTYVRNHGWENGHVTSYISVLQAGTAVFVNKYGTPVVKCYCGNPLTPWYPPVDYKPRWKCGCHYPEPYWPHWKKTTIIIIEKTTVIIDKYTLVDPKTGKPFTRPAGPTTTDAAYVPPGSVTALSASPTPAPTQQAVPPQQPPPPPPQAAPPPPPRPQPPQVTGRDAQRLLRSRITQCHNQGVRYPWEPAVRQRDTWYQVGRSLRWIVTVTDTTASGSTKNFAFEVDPIARTVHASSSWAHRAAQHCPDLNR